MKLRFYDRLFLFFSAVVIALIGLGLFILGLQTGEAAVSPDKVINIGRWPFLLAGLLLFLCGVYILSMPQKYRRQKDDFVVQQTASGELRISVKALEHLVQKCVASREEITLKGMSIIHQKDSVLVDLKVSLAGNVSIPLAVGSLQKQVKQHLLSSTGVDVKEVKVSVETADSNIKDSPFLIKEQLFPASDKDDKINPDEYEGERGKSHEGI